jgi:hypothetical protein
MLNARLARLVHYGGAGRSATGPAFLISYRNRRLAPEEIVDESF